MKDERLRQLKADSQITHNLPEFEPNSTLVPVKQVRLVKASTRTCRFDVQENDFIVTSNSDWAITLYRLEDRDGDGDDVVIDNGGGGGGGGVNDDYSQGTVSDFSYWSDNENEPEIHRFPIWTNVPVESDSFNDVKFIEQDIIACTEQQGYVSTWCAQSAQCFDSITLQGVNFLWSLCVISDTEFVAGTREGHLCFFTHQHGAQLKEMKRIWKAHSKQINEVVFTSHFVCSTSCDETARIWDVKSKTKLATLHHRGPVTHITHCEHHLLTCSHPFSDTLGTRVTELRLFRIDADKFSLVKVFVTNDFLMKPKYLNSNILMYWMRDIHSHHHTLMFFSIHSLSIVCQLKVHCRNVFDYAFLNDGRLVVCGISGSRAVIATLPRKLWSLLKLENSNAPRNVSSTRPKRRFCTIM